MSIWSDIEDRSMGKTVRKEDELLTKEETLLLQACTLLPFKIGRFSSIDDLLSELGVRIQIAPGIKNHVVPSELLQEKDYWEKERNKWKEDSPEYNEIRDILEKIRDEIRAWKAFPIRGDDIIFITSADRESL